MNLPITRVINKVKGIFQSSIPYNPLIANGDSSPYFGNFEGQRYGAYDTSDCWDFSSCELIETRIEMLWKMGLIPNDTVKWLQDNGYVDSDGDIYISRRWVAILSGAKDNGNDPLDFFRIVSMAGVIPNSMLPYSIEEAYKNTTRDNFNNDYYNPQVITKEMELMGIEFAKRFKIVAETLKGGYLKDVSVKLQTYLKEGSMIMSIPVPQDGTWNTTNVNYPKGRFNTDHAIEIYKFDPINTYPFFIYDSYEPHQKQLSANYYIPYLTRVSVTPISMPTTKPISPVVNSWTRFWMNVQAWLSGKPMPFPSVQIG